MRAFRKPYFDHNKTLKLDGWGWSLVIAFLIVLGIAQVLGLIVEVISSVV